MQITDGGGGDEVHFVLDRKADQPHLWLMPGTSLYQLNQLAESADA